MVILTQVNASHLLSQNHLVIVAKGHDYGRPKAHLSESIWLSNLHNERL